MQKRQKYNIIAVVALATTIYADSYSTQDTTKRLLTIPMSHIQEDKFMLGRSFFGVPWVVAPSATTARDGLGPLFITPPTK